MRSQTAQYSGELEFLNELRSGGSDLYRTAFWLRSEFSSPTWEIQFAPNAPACKIEFGIQMRDGTLLTEPAHATLLKTFKHWLCVQTHPHATSHRRLNIKTARLRIHRTLHIIDYLLLHQREIGLIDLGIGGLTSNTFFSVVSAAAKCNDVSEGIYDWSLRLGTFLRARVATLGSDDIESALHQIPELAMDLCDSSSLGLTSDELLAARVWLLKNDYYKSTLGIVRSGVMMAPNTLKITKQIYADTLWGKVKRTSPMELVIDGSDRMWREMRAVPVAEYDDERANEKIVASYLACISNLTLVQRTGVNIPTVALQMLGQREISSWLDLKDVGRFQLPPQDIVFTALRGAIEFPLRYGNALVDTYLNIAARAVQTDKSFSAVAGSSDFDYLLSQDLRELGVTTWRVNGRSVDFFERLRRSESFIDLMIVLVGSIVVAVGAVMARRKGELEDLDAFACLDKPARNLIFFNRKSGESNYRQREERPIPGAAVELIKILQRLQRGLIEHGLIDASGPLFRYPNRRTGRMCFSVNGVYRCIDRFCDYIDLPGREDGTRFYLRQHQFRRFFSVAFFWGSGFGGLDTLRWFLGQSDPAQVWRYVLESVPGKILMTVQSRYATQKILEGDPAADQLADILESTYGTRDFSVLSVTELEGYIESLLEAGDISVEPHFIQDDNGSRYQILIVIKSSNSSGGDADEGN